jgi:hypothetical protein
MIAATTVARVPVDGYTLLMAATPQVAMSGGEARATNPGCADHRRNWLTRVQGHSTGMA